MNSISSPTELVFMYTLTLYHKILLFQRKRTKKELWGEGDWELPQNLKGVKKAFGVQYTWGSFTKKYIEKPLKNIC